MTTTRPAPTPGAHAHTAAWAAARLRADISDGRLRPGDRLPEQSVAADLGISRNTLREAFAALAADAVVTREPNRGVHVTRPTAEDVREVYRTRRFLEPGVVLWAEPDASALADLERIAAGAQRALDAGDETAMDGANQRFHRTLVALAGSATLLAAMDTVLARMRLVFALRGSAADFHAAYVPRNAEIARLLRDGHREAAADVLLAYLADAEAEVLASLEAL